MKKLNLFLIGIIAVSALLCVFFVYKNYTINRDVKITSETRKSYIPSVEERERNAYEVKNNIEKSSERMRKYDSTEKAREKQKEEIKKMFK